MKNRYPAAAALTVIATTIGVSLWQPSTSPLATPPSQHWTTTTPPTTRPSATPMPPESLTDWSQTSPTTPRHGATEPVALSVDTSPAAPATTRAAATTVRASAQQRELTVQWLTVAQQQAQARAAAEAAARAAAAKAAAMRASQQRGPTPTPYHPDSSAPPATPATDGGGSGTFQQLAVCEEGGSNSATFGYYGILPSTWNGHDGVATAGEDSMANQQAFALSINGGRVPYAPVGCGNAGYHGW